MMNSKVELKEPEPIWMIPLDAEVGAPRDEAPPLTSALLLKRRRRLALVLLPIVNAPVKVLGP